MSAIRAIASRGSRRSKSGGTCETRAARGRPALRLARRATGEHRPIRWVPYARAAAQALVAAVAWGSSSCAPNGFASQSLVESVRILASSADEPYARPGDRVHVTVLAFDGRSADERAASPMNLGWLPLTDAGLVRPCVDPANDAYYACFAGFGPSSIPPPGASAASGPSDAAAPEPCAADGADCAANPGDAGLPCEAGAADCTSDLDAGDVDGGEAESCPPGEADCGAGPEDAQPPCPPDAEACGAGFDGSVAPPRVATAEFTMPADIVTSHPLVAGTSPYGLAILFNVACAGRVEYVPPSSNNPNPQQAPVGCFDDAGGALGPDDYVFGFTRVYSRVAPDGGYYSNANPVISGVDLPPCALQVRGSVPSYAASELAVSCTPSNCPNVTLGAVVPPSSWEVNPLDVDANGNPLHEEIWANYYSTFGGFTSETRLLYDPTSGAVSGADTQFQPPSLGPDDLHDGFVFAVVYDDRGGESWVSIPTHVCSDPADPACSGSSCGPSGG